MPSRNIIFALVGTTLITILAFLSRTVLRTSLCTSLSFTNPVVESANQHQYSKHRDVHVLIPIDKKAANDSGSKFCKTIFSAIVHGYQPVILNWEAGDHGWFGGQRLKVLGIECTFA